MTRRRRILFVAALAAAVAALLLVAPAFPTPRTENAYRVAAYPTNLVYFAVVGWLVYALLAFQDMRARWMALTVAGLLALVLLLNWQEVPVASDLAKIGFGTFAGMGLARAIERPWWLLPICVMVPLADAWSVFSDRGVTNAVVEKAAEEPAWIEWPTIAAPIAGVPYEHFGRLGIVDILFLALFLAVVARAGLGIRRATWLLPLGFVATTVISSERAGLAIPALPVLCLLVLLLLARPLWRDLRDDFAARE